MRARSLLPAILGTVSLCGLKCNGEYLVDSSTGSVEVVIETSGDDPDPNGYTVQVDGSEPQPAGPAASINIAELTPGDHTVTLGDVAPNCSAAEGLVRTVNVPDQATASIRYAIACVAAPPPRLGPALPDAKQYSAGVDARWGKRELG